MGSSLLVQSSPNRSPRRWGRGPVMVLVIHVTFGQRSSRRCSGQISLDVLIITVRLNDKHGYTVLGVFTAI